MGYKLLKTTILLFLLINFSYGNSDLKKIDNLIDKIKVKRVGLNSSEIKILKDPFHYNKKAILKGKKRIYKRHFYKHYYRLYAIINDKAKIDGKWYKIGSQIGKYKLYNICHNCVKLKKREKMLTLYIPKKNRKIKISISK